MITAIILWLALIGWFLALYFGARLHTAEEQLEAQDWEIDTLRARCKSLNRQRPMVFRSMPTEFAAHIHRGDAGQVWLTWDN